MGEEMRTESVQRRRTWIGDREGMVGKKRHVGVSPCEAGASACLSPSLLSSSGSAACLSHGHTHPARDGARGCPPPDNARGVTGYH